MEKIGGMANLQPDMTGENLDLLMEKNTIFLGRFVESDGHVSVAVRTPPRGLQKNYLYAKQSGKAYALECNFKRREDILLWHLNKLPASSVADKFVAVVPAHELFITGYTEAKTGLDKNAVVQRPELANLTEDSNPVVILYGFKEGL